MTQHDGSGARSTPGRLEFERAIRRSDLPPPSRHLALTIATWADMDTGVIPERFQPSLSTLEEATGMGRKTVRTHLNNLEDRKWLERHRPDQEKARTEHARTRYALAIPPEARGGETLALGAEGPQPRGAEPPAKGRRAPRARGGEPPKSPYESPESQDSSAAGKPDSSSEQQEQPSKPNKHQVADDLTAAFWDRHGKGRAQPFITIRGVIRTAISNGVERDDLARALEHIAIEGRWSISGATLDTALGKIRNARGPYQNSDDQDVYDEELK